MTGNSYIHVPGVIHSVDDNTRHWAYINAIPRSEKEKQASIHKTDFGGATVPRDIRVHDGRQEKLSLDDTGFELIDCPTALSTSDFYDIQKGEGDVKERYYGELEAMVKKTLGCDKVICFHHQVRNQDRTGQDGVQGYAGIAPHTDSSPVSGDQVALQMADGNEENYERYAYINVWRNIAEEPIGNDHLAMLDERTTVKPDDYIPKDLFMDGYHVVQYGLNARHASSHKWYYYPEMKKEEAIIFKQMDSDYSKLGRICFHMSVNDPNAEASAPPRQSIEVRMMCYWSKTDGGLNTMPSKENTNASMIKDAEQVVKNLSSESFSILGLLQKIPVLNWFIGDTQEATAYSGKPADYLDRFVTAINYFPSWPAAGVSWAKGVMKKNGVEDGIAAITRGLVDDALNYQKTKKFKKDEKKEIVDFLLSNEKYTSTAMKHLEKLA